jgi:Pollen protein Ole e 1 like
VVCDVCVDSSVDLEDYVLEGAEVVVLCIIKSGVVINYQAFTNSRGVYSVAEMMSESDKWESYLVRLISSFNEHCVN